MEEITRLALAGLIGLVIGYLLKNKNLNKEIIENNNKVSDLINGVREDIKEARIEREAVLNYFDDTQKLVKDFEAVYWTIVKREREEREQEHKRELNTNKTDENSEWLAQGVNASATPTPWHIDSRDGNLFLDISF